MGTSPSQADLAEMAAGLLPGEGLGDLFQRIAAVHDRAPVKAGEARRQMADIVDRQTRSRMMSGIRGKDTKPEMELRWAHHARGFRYRLHGKGVPGRPGLKVENQWVH